MSVTVKISDLNDIQLNKIVNDLNIVPFDKRAEDIKLRGGNVTSKPKEPIDLKIINRKEKTINIPYFFARLLFNNNKINFSDKHAKVFDTNLEFGTELRDHQYPIIDEALDQLNKYYTTTLSLPPGYGKTIMGALLAFIKKYMWMALIHRDIIGDAWMETIKICYPTLIHKIWYVGDKKSPWKLPINDESDFPFFIICMKERSHYIPKYILEKIGTLIVDEAHLFCTKDSVDSLLVCNPRFVILETATLKRDDKMERMMYNIVGEHEVYRIDDRPYTIYKINTFVQGIEEKNAMGTLDAGKLYQSLSNSEYRNNIILNIIETNPTHKFMILTKYNDHVHKLCELLDENDLDNDNLCGNKKEYSDSFVLVGTTPKMGTGFDESKACVDFKGITSDVLIICHSTPNIPLFIQMKGRVMRNKKPIIIWFNDKNAMVKSHFRKIKPIIEETNGTIIEMDYYPGGIKFPSIKKSRLVFS